MRILVTRPLEDGAEIAARLAERGPSGAAGAAAGAAFLRWTAEPANWKVCRRSWPPAPMACARLARAPPRRDIPIFAVGPQTAEEAPRCGIYRRPQRRWRCQGAGRSRGALGDARQARCCMSAARTRPEHWRSSSTSAGFTVRRAVLYRIEPATAVAARDRWRSLRERVLDAAMFFSPRTARHFRATGERLCPQTALTALCISRATAEALAPRAFAQITGGGSRPTRTPCWHLPNKALKRRGFPGRTPKSEGALPKDDANPAGIRSRSLLSWSFRAPCIAKTKSSACGMTRPACTLRSCSMKLSPTLRTLAARISWRDPAASRAPARMRPMPNYELGKRL